MVAFLPILIMCLVGGASADEETTDVTATADDLSVENNIQEIEHLTALAEKSRREGILPTEHTEELYNKIAISFSDLVESIDAKNNTYKFFNVKGINRIVIPNIRTVYAPVRTQLLNLLKTLFKKAPTTTKAFTPVNIVDMLLDVFENDDNLALKAHALDVLYLWLPNNPKLQARVMKLKGLQPFYEQITKLDSDVVSKLLDLFNKILEEHLRARNEKEQRNRNDYETFKLYQKIGLVERMSTPTVCHGLLNIFKDSIVFGGNSEDIFVPVTKLLKNVKPFCLDIYKGKNTAIDIFQQLRDYFKESILKNMFKSMQLNVTEVDLILNEYNEQLKEHFKDEF